MKAFLCHNSANKSFVSDVFSRLGSANAEYDEETFSAGGFNAEAIRTAMARCQVFALFATVESLKSGYVQHEIALAGEYFALGRVRSIVTFCVAPVVPDQLPEKIRSISAVRRAMQPGTCARLLQNELIALEITANPTSRPYLGRERVTADITDRLARPDAPTPLALAFSGVDGIGRRTLASKILADVYPPGGTIRPVISIPQNQDIRDLYRALLDLMGGLTKAELFQKVTAFDAEESDRQLATIASSVQTYNDAGETVFLLDTGGILDDSGRIASPLSELLSALEGRNPPRPYFVLVLFRTPPGAAQEQHVEYFRVGPLESRDVGKLVSLHVKAKGQLVDQEVVDTIVDLIDGHPYNLQFLLRLLDTHSIETLSQDPSDLIAFKLRQGDEFVAKLDLSDQHRQVLAVLRVLGPSPIELIHVAVDLSPDDLAKALKQLDEFHCVERHGNVCSLNRPLRFAFDRSTSIRLTPDQVSKLQTRVLDLFNAYTDEDQISIELVSAAARAAVYLNKEDDVLKAFLLPSSSVYVARQLYDLRRFGDCARVCQSALTNQRFISDSARVEAIRLRCLSLARLGEDDAFDKAIDLLNSTVTPQKAMRLFLEGFKLRLNGQPADAADKYKASLKLKAKSFATLRELSHCLLVLGETKAATSYAENALAMAPTNPFVIDQMLAIRIAQMDRVKRDIIYDPKIGDLLDRLEKYGDEEGKSFYAIRMADILRRANELSEALEYARRACGLTPYLVPAHLAEAEILLRMGHLDKVEGKLDILQRLIEDRNSGERRSRLTEFLRLKIDYLMAKNKHSDAVALLRSNTRRMHSSVEEAKRKLAFIVENSGQSDLTAEDRAWLRS